MSTHVEVVVAGGGPAGAAAAIVLARRGRRVLLADGDRGDAFRIGEAVPPAVRPLLRDLGVLDLVLADGHLPCPGNVSVWGSGEPVATDFIFDPNGLGLHLDRARFDDTLREAARNAGAEVVRARILGAVCEGRDWWVTLTGDKPRDHVLRTAWLMDATGRRAAVARRAGAARRRDDVLVASYARFRTRTGTDLDGRTAVESEPDGWWYTARVPSGERVVAFLTDADLIDRAAILSATGFGTRLGSTRYVHGLLQAHRYEMVGPPRAVSAETARLDRVSGAGWAAVGDAAISFDPLSSQGILTALFTGLRAGQAADRALAGDLAAVEAYRCQVHAIDRAYRRHRDTCYAAEGRWPDRPFWRRRLGVGFTPTS
ncbi:MAG: tryptophan 7-halogenase [Planctomycetes bacterium]|nr:tryptophan 7-halogenase [Planctomycetota bacterium]